MMGNRCRISSMETSPLHLALKAVVFLGFVRSPFLFVLDSFLLAYLNFTRSLARGFACNFAFDSGGKHPRITGGGSTKRKGKSGRKTRTAAVAQAVVSLLPPQHQRLLRS